MLHYPRYGCLFCDKHYNSLRSLGLHHDSYLSECATANQRLPQTDSFASHPVDIIRYVRMPAPRRPKSTDPVIVWNPITVAPSPGELWDIVVLISDHHQLALFLSRRPRPATRWHDIFHPISIIPSPTPSPFPFPVLSPVPVPTTAPPAPIRLNVMSPGKDLSLIAKDRGSCNYSIRNGPVIGAQHGGTGSRQKWQEEEKEKEKEEQVYFPRDTWIDMEDANDDDLYCAPPQILTAASPPPPPHTPSAPQHQPNSWYTPTSLRPTLLQLAIHTKPQNPPFIINITRASTLTEVLHRIEETLVGPLVGVCVDGQTGVLTEEGLEVLKVGRGRVWVTLVLEEKGSRVAG